jgi:hypothetical protein
MNNEEKSQKPSDRYSGPTGSSNYLWVNAIALAGVILVNTLANALPINGQTTGEISAKYSNLFVPAGWAFSIWGVIYLLLIIWVVLGIVRHRRGENVDYILGVSRLFWISCAANMAWIFAWHFDQLILSVVLMLVLLLSLLQIYLRLLPQRENIPAWAHAPFSIYLGWVSVASIANVSALLVDFDWRGGPWPETLWTVAMIVVATLLGLFFILKKKGALYGLLIVWALAAIYSRRIADLGADDGAVEIAALFGVALLTMTIALRLFVPRKA